MSHLDETTRAAAKGIAFEVDRLEREVDWWESQASSAVAELHKLERQSPAPVTAEHPPARASETAIQRMELGMHISGAQAAAARAAHRLLVAREELATTRAANKRDQAERLL